MIRKDKVPNENNKKCFGKLPDPSCQTEDETTTNQFRKKLKNVILKYKKIVFGDTGKYPSKITKNQV